MMEDDQQLKLWKEKGSSDRTDGNAANICRQYCRIHLQGDDAATCSA